MQGSATQPQTTKSRSNQFMKYLPKDPQQRAQLKEAIQKYSDRLKKKYKTNPPPPPSQEQKIKILDLRSLLIDSCSQMSLLRLDHLEWIFKHYCTHIFKTGKHITFQRIQYQKVHLTMQRFFLFLKDFQLTIMKNGDNKKQEVIDKNTIILLFKKISSNSRDVNFQEFIRLIQRIAVLYYDQKQVFYQKRQKMRQEKQKRKQQYQKKKMLRLKRQQQADNQGNQHQNQNQNQNNQQNQNIGNKEQQQHQQVQSPKQVPNSGTNKNNKKVDNTKNSKQKQKQKQNANIKKQPIQQQNDQLIKDMLNNKDIQDPNEQINKITNRYALQQQQQQLQQGQGKGQTQGQKNTKNLPALKIDDNLLLLLTTQQKIQYFYKFMVQVDSIKQYRDKLTQINLPIFNKGKGNKSTQAANSSQKNVKTSQDEQASNFILYIVGIQQLKKKMDQKKLKQKSSPIPKPKDDGAWIKAQQQKKKRRQLKKQRQVQAKQKSKNQSDALLQKKIDAQKSIKQKKPEYNEKQVDWNILGKMSIQQLKINKFNPNRYFSRDDDDRIFLEEYENGGRPRMNSRMDGRQRERNSMSIVEDVKKRIGEVQKKQKRQEKDLEKKIGQNVPIKGRF